MSPLTSSPKSTKQLHLNFFNMACAASHMCIGQWKDSSDNTQTKGTLDYYLWLAKLVEKIKSLRYSLRMSMGYLRHIKGKQISCKSRC